MFWHSTRDELLGARLDRVGDAEQREASLRRGRVAPLLERLLRRLGSGVHVIGGAHRRMSRTRRRSTGRSGRSGDLSKRRGVPFTKLVKACTDSSWELGGQRPGFTRCADDVGTVLLDAAAGVALRHRSRIGHRASQRRKPSLIARYAL